MLKKFVSSALLFLVLAQGAVAIPGPGPVTFPCGRVSLLWLRGRQRQLVSLSDVNKSMKLTVTEAASPQIRTLRVSHLYDRSAAGVIGG
ncbi:hypothetical protein B0H13DRAFT_1979857 [Mycena leptocephala]|nr:hypothetical protein B0H13DRAFT_1979857 [Mycena leptocephala]